MYCKFCGKEIGDKVELCTHCGRRVRGSFSTFLESNELTKLKPIREEKSPGLAGFLGFFLSWILLGPLGYVYLGQWNWFWITLIISVIAYIPTVGLAYILFPFVFAFHQHQMAKDLNESLKNAKLREHSRTEGTRSPTEG